MKTLPIIAILTLTVMMVFPSTLPRVHATLSNGNNYFAAYGPNVDNLLYTVYVDFGTMKRVTLQSRTLTIVYKHGSQALASPRLPQVHLTAVEPRQQDPTV